MIVYSITNSISGKQYVGQTVLTLEERENWYYLHYKYRGNANYIARAMYKHGFDNFDFRELKRCDTRTELDFWEMYYIRKLNTLAPSGYNLKDGGRYSYNPDEVIRTTLREKLVLKRYHTLKADSLTEAATEMS